MGQNSSAFQNSPKPLFPRRTPHQPHSSHLAAPDEMAVPQTPTYAVAENKVLPNGISDISAARKLLRPVSQELSKLRPEYADIFQHTRDANVRLGHDSSMNDSLNAGFADKENSTLAINTPRNSTTITRMSNEESNRASRSSISNDIIPSLHERVNSSDAFISDQIKGDQHAGSVQDELPKMKPDPILLRSQSMTTNLAYPVQIPKHKRQTSLANGRAIQESVIMEDPREHLYNETRNIPFSNYQPSATSLPLQSTFDMDYSMNLTYAQLAEYRRNKRTTELEERTGRKLEELGAEINASSTVPKSPFDIQNLGARSNTTSMSTGSSDTGVSKSKKKRAPAPPTPQSAIRHHSRDVSSLSEPFPDYDTQDSSITYHNLRGRSLQRSISSTSKNSKPPAPQPLPKSLSYVSLYGSSVTHPDPQLKNLPTASTTLPRPESGKNQSPGASKVRTTFVTDNRQVQLSVIQAKAQLEALMKLQDNLKREQPIVKSTLENNIRQKPTENAIHSSAETINVMHNKTIHDNNGNTLIKDNPLDVKHHSEVHRPDELEIDVQINRSPRPDVNETDVRRPDVNETDAHQREVHGTEMHENKSPRPGVQVEEMHQPEIHKTDLYHDVASQPEVHKTELYPSDVHQSPVHQTHVTSIDFKPATKKDNSDLVVLVISKESLEGMNPLLQNDIIAAARNIRDRSDIAKQHFATEQSKIPSHNFDNKHTENVIAGEDKITIVKSSDKANVDSLSTSKAHDNKATIPSDANKAPIPSDANKATIQSDANKATIQSDANKATIQSDANKATIQSDANKATIQSYANKATKRQQIPDWDIQTSITMSSQTEQENVMVEDTQSSSYVWKYDEKPSQMGEDSASIDFSKRSSIQSEDMSISSSNTSQRVFSPDWAPEHDLDSDDDIMDVQQTRTQREIHSEGFKPSIIPSKLSDLKEKKAKANSKRNKKDSVRKEEERPFAEVKTKIGSIRQFKKSVHQSMKSVFGSMSKASGTLINRQRSQDFTDSRKAQYKTSGDSEDDASELTRNSNWTLSNSEKGSLRRAASDGFVSRLRASEVGHPVLLDNSDEQIADIDFAGGINDVAVLPQSSNKFNSGVQNQKMLKRAGVAYVSEKGQIIVLPEHRTTKVDKATRVVSDILGNEGYVPKSQSNKEMKYDAEPVLRVHDKDRIEEALEVMILEKEQQYKIERMRQQEMETNFRRLQDIEAHGRIQRIQKDSMQEHIAQLHQEHVVRRANNELNNNAVSMTSLNNLTNITSVPGINNAFVSTGWMSQSPYISNNDPNILSPGYFESPIHLGQTSQQPFSLSSFPTVALAQPISQIAIPNIIADTLSYSTHPTSFADPLSYSTRPTSFADPLSYSTRPTSFVSGSSISGGLSSSAIHKLTPQELSFLSDYMRVIGVPPPSNPHQWAMLLSNVAYNTSDLPHLDGHLSLQQSSLSPESGPDLSHIFGSGKTLDLVTSNAEIQTPDVIPREHSFDIPSPQHLPTNTSTYIPLHFQSTATEQHLYDQQPLLASSNNNINSLDVIKSTSTTQPLQDGSPSTTTKNTAILPLTTVPATASDNKFSISVDKISNSTPTNVTQADSITLNSTIVTGNDTTPNQHSPRTYSLPAKVYGPIGFRPVSFSSVSTR